MTRALAIVAASAALLLAGCGGDDPEVIPEKTVSTELGDVTVPEMALPEGYEP